VNKKELIEKLRRVISKNIGCLSRNVIIKDITRYLNWTLKDDNGEFKMLGGNRPFNILIEFHKKDTKIKFSEKWMTETRILYGKKIFLIPMIDEAYFILDDSFENFTIVKVEIKNWHNGMKYISDIPNLRKEESNERVK